MTVVLVSEIAPAVGSLLPGVLDGALAEVDGETVRVLRVSRDKDGRALTRTDGTLPIVEKEAV